MVKRIVNVVGLAAAAGVVISLAVSQAVLTAQTTNKPNAEDRKAAARGTGADANVKVGPEQAVKDAKFPMPDAKSGEKTRQLTCQLEFDNWTDAWIEVYADGTYRGTVPPGGELYSYVIAGPTTVYGRTPSRAFTWGPRIVQCNSFYSWRLNP